jgi:PAS domain S-box-containing protein
MDLFTFFSLVTAMLLFSLGIFVFARNPKSPLHQVFLLLILTIFWWAFTEFMMRTATSLPDADFWMRLNAFWTFIPVFSLNFMWIFTERAGKQSDTWIYPSMYLPAILFCALELATGLINAKPVMGYWGYTYGLAENPWIYYTEMTWAFVLLLLTLLGGLDYYLKCQDARKKKQAEYILIGFASSSMVAFVFLVVLPVVSNGVQPYAGIPFPPMFIISILFFSGFIGYGIWKHNLFVLTPESIAETIISTTTDMLILLDADGKIALVNRAVRETLLYPEEELIGSPVSRVICDIPEKPGFLAEITRQDGRLSDTGMLCRKKDNTTIPVSISGSVIRDHNGSISGMVIIARDITEREMAEEALRVSRQKLAEAMDIANLADWEYDVGRGVFIFNDRFYALYGTTAGREGGMEMAPETYNREFIHPDDQDLLAPAVEKALKITDPDFRAQEEHRIIRRDGTVRHIIARIGVTIGEDGRVIKTHGANQDITERRLAEEALQKSEEKFRSFVENASEIIFSLTPEGIFTYVSPQWTTLLGDDTSEVIGKNYSDFIHPDDLPGNLEVFREIIETGKKVSGREYRVRHKNGTWHWHSQGISPVRDANGKVVAVQGISHDMTERKRADDALRLANRQLKLLSSITRHDINNKITVILGYLKIAQRRSTDPALEEYFGKMTSATQEIRTQIEFTRIYQDIGTHEPQWIDLDTVMPCDHVPQDITFRSDVCGILVYASPMLERVFFNLLDNSLRHGQQVTEIGVSFHKEGDRLVVLWEDNGGGVAADEKEAIFERGYGKNTGLGMFLVREILSLTDITIRETGEPGKGARFEMIVRKGAYRFTDGA